VKIKPATKDRFSILNFNRWKPNTSKVVQRTIMDPPICWGEVEPAGGEKGEKAGEKPVTIR